MSKSKEPIKDTEAVERELVDHIYRHQDKIRRLETKQEPSSYGQKSITVFKLDEIVIRLEIQSWKWEGIRNIYVNENSLSNNAVNRLIPVLRAVPDNKTSENATP